MTTKVYRTCKWLIEKLLKKRYMTFEEINEEWVHERALSNGVELLRKTFYNNRKKLKETFGIEIVCKDGGDYPYYIKNPKIVRSDNLAWWMMACWAHLAGECRFERAKPGMYHESNAWRLQTEIQLCQSWLP